MSEILNFEMQISQLGRQRKVWVYLPDDYSNGQPKPVIYMHDGQNLFYPELTAYGAAWNVHTTLDKLFAQEGMSAVVVGVECLGKHRLSEYSPWKASLLRRATLPAINNGGEGEQYAQFFVQTLLPHIQSTFNVCSQRDGIAVAGSSMGGLISCYLGLKFQQTFGTMGLFSSYTEFNQGAFDAFLRRTPQTQPQHAYIYCGGKEWDYAPANRRILNASFKLYRNLSKRGVCCRLDVDCTQKHYETAWEIYFEHFARDFLRRYYGK